MRVQAGQRVCPQSHVTQHGLPMGTAKPQPALASSHVTSDGPAAAHPVGHGLNILPARLSSACWTWLLERCSIAPGLPEQEMLLPLAPGTGIQMLLTFWGKRGETGTTTELCPRKSCLGGAGTRTGEWSCCVAMGCCQHSVRELKPLLTTERWDCFCGQQHPQCCGCSASNSCHRHSHIFLSQHGWGAAHPPVL